MRHEKTGITAIARWLVVAALGVLVGSLAACGGGGEIELLTQSRDGMFYTVFADAQEAAAREDKLILLDLWRPG